jgi:hypothetical protein
MLSGVVVTTLRRRQCAQLTSPFRNVSQKERGASVLIVLLLGLSLAAAGGIYFLFLGHGNAGVSGIPRKASAVTQTPSRIVSSDRPIHLTDGAMTVAGVTITV